MSDHISNKPRAVLFADRNFRWLISGGMISMLGDQFTLIALPWLMLKITGDTLMLGAILAVISIPRAVFILIGGAIVDRHSPRRVLMITKYINLVLLGLLGGLVLLGALKLWMVFALAFGIGLSTAFSIPSATALMPHVVAREQLQQANSVMMSMRQATMFAGPLLAGLLIALFGDGGAGMVGDARGLGFAFLIDAFSFGLSAWTLAQVALPTKRDGQALASTPASKPQPVLKAVADGLRWCWNDRDMRLCFMYWAAVMFFVVGPIQVAIPVVAVQLGDSAAAFGMLAGMHGAGMLVGMVVSGVFPRLRVGSFGTTMLLVDFVVGALFVMMAGITAIWQGSLFVLIIGALSGFLQIIVYTWMQRRVAPAMLGRVMSLFMFIVVGIAPLSAAITGWLMRSVSANVMFAGSGGMLIAIVIIAWATSSIRGIAETSGLASDAAEMNAAARARKIQAGG
ncbi:MFS transporter [soil metagenome]